MYIFFEALSLQLIAFYSCFLGGWGFVYLVQQEKTPETKRGQEAHGIAWIRYDFQCNNQRHLFVVLCGS